MDDEYYDSSNEEKDIKPIISSPTSYSEPLSLHQELESGPKKWSPSSLQDSNRKSAFQPYKQSYTFNTVLTNLQRGNTQAETPLPQPTEVNLYTRAGQGEITEEDLKLEDIDKCDSNGLTLLHWACAYGQFNTVELLLHHDTEVNKLGPDEETPLILAANGGHHEVVRLLLRYGADVNHVDHVSNIDYVIKISDLLYYNLLVAM